MEDRDSQFTAGVQKLRAWGLLSGFYCPDSYISLLLNMVQCAGQNLIVAVLVQKSAASWAFNIKDTPFSSVSLPLFLLCLLILVS